MKFSIKVVVAACLCRLVLSASAFENEVWISPKGPPATNANITNLPAWYPNTNVLGTETYPFRCTNAAELNYVLGTVLTGNYLTIHLMAGTFETLVLDEKVHYSIKLHRGWKLRGAGMENTVVRLTSGNDLGGMPLTLIANYGYGRWNDVEVSDMTIDCNLQGQTQAPMVDAVALFGNNTRISRVKAINWGNTGATLLECFVMYLSVPSGLHETTNSVIEDCVVTQPAPVRQSASGCIALAVFSESQTNGHGGAGILRNNLICNVRVGSGPGEVGHIFAFGLGDDVTIAHNQGVNLIDPENLTRADGVYGDTRGITGSIIDGNEFVNVSCGMFVNDIALTNIIIKNNVFKVASGGIGLAIFSPPSPQTPVENLVVENNVIMPAARATNVTAFGFGTSNATATVTGNIFESNGSGYDLRMPGQMVPDLARNPHSQIFWTWINNVNRSGGPLKSFGGFDPDRGRGGRGKLAGQ